MDAVLYSCCGCSMAVTAANLQGGMQLLSLACSEPCTVCPRVTDQSQVQLTFQSARDVTPAYCAALERNMSLQPCPQ